MEFPITHLNDYTLQLGHHAYVPLVVGGMGVDTSTPALVLAVALLGGIAHLSDAMLPAVVDRHFGTHYVRDKQQQYRAHVGQPDKTGVHFDLNELYTATYQYVDAVMSAKRGEGGIFLNVMEKLTMASPRPTLQTRLTAALDAGIDGITLGAGLHLGTLDLLREHPRFRDAKLGIIVSSARALKLFLARAAKVGRMPDYIVVEGPLAGGHLGFPLNWQDFDLATIVAEVQQLLAGDNLSIPVIPAGGIFTGSDAVAFMRQGAAAVQVATRFTVTEECGLPADVKQAFFAAEPDDVVVNGLSATGYPMRMLRSSPAIETRVAPMCEAFGYALDGSGTCPYNTAYHQPEVQSEKNCLCAMMYGYKIWTCGHTVARLKETSHRLPDGSYQLLKVAQVFEDYTRSTDGRILLPPAPELAVARMVG